MPGGGGGSAFSSTISSLQRKEGRRAEMQAKNHVICNCKGLWMICTASIKEKKIPEGEGGLYKENPQINVTCEADV